MHACAAGCLPAWADLLVCTGPLAPVQVYDGADAVVLMQVSQRRLGHGRGSGGQRRMDLWVALGACSLVCSLAPHVLLLRCRARATLAPNRRRRAAASPTRVWAWCARSSQTQRCGGRRQGCCGPAWLHAWLHGCIMHRPHLPAWHDTLSPRRPAPAARARWTTVATSTSSAPSRPSRCQPSRCRRQRSASCCAAAHPRKRAPGCTHARARRPDALLAACTCPWLPPPAAPPPRLPPALPSSR